MFHSKTPIILLVFALAVSACGGGGSSSSPPVNVTPPPAPSNPSLSTTPVFTNLSFAAPVALRQAPGDNSRWFVVEQAGRILRFDNTAGVSTSEVFLDISSQVNNLSSETGMLSMAFHPDFPATPRVFVLYSTNGALRTRLAGFELLSGGDTLDPASETVLLEVPQPQSNHNGGDLVFSADGLLLASFGDGGGGGDPGENAQNTTNLLGAVVRINVDGTAPYDVPADNPFAGSNSCQLSGQADNCAEIFAWGLRNPWRMSVDSLSGDLWLADVGQNEWEEVNRVVLGGNYGWNDREGAHCFDPPANCADTFAEPVAEYDHSAGQSVTGGYVYRGTVITDLAGWYLFGDFVSGRLFAVEADAAPTEAALEVGDTSLSISTFGQDQDGELYVVNYANGSVHQVVDAN